VLLVLTQALEAQDLPLEDIIDPEAADVEVCQDDACTRLREEILQEASKCRPLARFKARRMRVRRAKSANSCKLFREENFKLSKGKCSAAVRDACERAGLEARNLNVNAYDLYKKGLMEKAGFVNLIWKYTEKTAPLGAILIYVGGLGHRYGHVEVRVNPRLYCSDYCRETAVSEGSDAARQRYKIVGVYLPFSSSIQVTGTNVQRPNPGS